MDGWTGELLRVNLSTNSVSREALEPALLAKFIGGRGLNIKILYDETEAGLDPLSPKNKLVLGAGPCNGTLVPGSSRLAITAKSPLTGMFGVSSGGGRFGSELKFAGYDVLVIEGRAERPVYLWINDGDVQIREASALWGKMAFDARKILQREVGCSDCAVLAIGPAGEKLVKFASITSDRGRSHGKTGMGAVMGSKNCKAVAVRGTQGVKVAGRELLKKAQKQLVSDWHENPDFCEIQAKYGPTFILQLQNEQIGNMPVKNYREGTWGANAVPLYGTNLQADYYLKPRACFSCPVPCDRVYVIQNGKFSGTTGIGLYNIHQFHLGTNLAINDPRGMLRAAYLCDQYGIDVSMIGAISAWLMECLEKGILTQADTEGFYARWGSVDDLLALIELIANRRGIGDLLAEGIKASSETVGKGSAKYAMHVKGLAVDIDDPRANKSWALGCAVAGRGAEHCMGMSMSELGFGGWDPERGECIDGNKVDGKSETGKGKLYKWLEDIRAFQHSMQVCQFVYMYVFAPRIGQPAMAARMFNAVTGLGMTEKDVLTAGERIINLEKAYNIREGWRREDDTLPERFLKEMLPGGAAAESTVNLEPMIAEYYKERGWDEYGLPGREKLKSLGLEDVADKVNH